MIPFDWFIEASNRIRPYIKKTPLTYDKEYDIYLKWENHQKTGSFKLRGAINKILSLQDWELKKGLVTASAGNHGQGVAMAARLVEAQVTIFASDHAVQTKLEAMQSLGAKIILVPGGYGEAEQAGIKFAQDNQSTWISPYNDVQVVAGQGTLALEVLEDCPESSSMTWIVPVGGGGLISGIGTVIKNEILAKKFPDRQKQTQPYLIGVQPEKSAFMHAIFTIGDQSGVQDLPTLADGLSGPVEQNSITIPMVRKYVDEIIKINEDDIAQAIAFAWKKYGETIEGSAAVTLAVFINHIVKMRPAVLIVSGGNIQRETFDRIVG